MTLSHSPDQAAFGDDEALYQSIRSLIERSRSQVVAQVNQALVLTYWQVGKTIKTTLVTEDRAEYGKAIVEVLARKLSQEYGNGFSQSNLFRMIRFYERFSDESILATLSPKLSWSHFVELLKLDEPLKREFYLQLCADGRWSVRTLRGRIDSMLFERTALSKQPDALIRQELTNLQKQSPETSPALFLKDPYLLDFLDLKDNFSEKDLENAVLFELERFILELGSDFAFMARQRRIQVGGNDYYLDLLFYHRKLKRLVLLELKLESFKPEHKGQVELYLKWLAKYEQQPGEYPPIAIILCSSADAQVVELMDLEQDNVHVAEYWLQLPPKDVLQAKLHKAMIEAKARLGGGV